MTPVSLWPYVPSLALEWLRDSPEADHRSVEGSMAFVDISGFTPLTERLTRLGAVGSEELSDILDSTFTALLSEARAEGADLVKWGGDAVLLLFRGAGHAARAVRVALGMRHALYSVGRTTSSAGHVTLRLSVGIHSGVFDFFLVGAPEEHRELLVSGPAASRVAELEGLATAGQVAVSAATAALLPARSVGSTTTGYLVVRRAPGRDPTGHDGRRDQVGAAGDPGPDGPGHVGELLSPPVRAHLLAGGAEPEHRTVAVAFVQFSGTDRVLREEGPSAAAAALDHLVRSVQAACARHGVTFLESDINTDGGKVMLVCGAPTRAEDVEDRLVRAVREIVDAEGALTLRAGVNRGRVFASDFGPAFRRTYSVKGDAINVAARVMGHAAPGQVLVTRSVADRVGEGIRQQEVPAFRVKGKSRPVEAALVTAVQPWEGPTPTQQVFLGREQEVAAVLERLDRARAGRGQLVEVHAGPGLGKSALVQAVVDRCGQDVTVLHGPSRRFGSSASHQAVRRLLRDAVGARPGDPVDSQLDALRHTVATTAPHVLPWLPLLAPLLGARLPDTPQVRDLDPHFRPARAARAVRDLLTAALPGTTLFVLEGADDMDGASGDIVRELLAARPGRPWTFVLTRRAPDRGLVTEDGEVELALDLQPLSLDTSRALLTEWAQDHPLGDQQLRAVAAKAGGNPLHLRSLLELAVARGTVEGLPDGVEEVIGAEIDELGPRARTILRFASVLGERFDLEDLAGLVAAEGWSVRPEDLSQLEAQLVPEGPTHTWYRFSSSLLHDVAYAGLPYQMRRRLHLRSGETLEARPLDPVPLEALSTHFFEAGRYDKALDYSHRAAERARQAFSSLQAMTFYERALACAARTPGTTPTLVGRLHEAAGDAAELAGLSEVAIERYRAARASLRADSLAVAGVMAKEIAMHQRVGAFDRSTRIAVYARRSLAEVAGPEADALRSRLAVQTAFVHHLRSRHDQAVAWSRTAVEEASRSGDPGALARAYNGHALVLAVAGLPADRPYGELALRSSVQAGDLQLQGKCLTNLAISAIIDGRWPRAEQLLARAAVVAERAGDDPNVANVTYNRCDVLVRQGRWAEAAPLLTSVGRTARAQHDLELVALVELELGKVGVGGGRLSRARSHLETARAQLTGLGLVREAADADVVLLACDVAAARSSEERAATAAAVAEALPSVSSLGSEDGRGRLHFLRGALLMADGRPVAASAAFEDGLLAPPGEGGYSRALNELGLAEAGAAAGRPRPVSRARAEATFARLGVRELPIAVPWASWSYTAPR